MSQSLRVSIPRSRWVSFSIWYRRYGSLQVTGNHLVSVDAHLTLSSVADRSLVIEAIDRVFMGSVCTDS